MNKKQILEVINLYQNLKNDFVNITERDINKIYRGMKE